MRARATAHARGNNEKKKKEKRSISYTVQPLLESAHTTREFSSNSERDRHIFLSLLEEEEKKDAPVWLATRVFLYILLSVSLFALSRNFVCLLEFV